MDSIRKNYPSGTEKDTGNALMIQNVDEYLFAAIYSFHGETLLAKGELSRITKEEISIKVSENNECCSVLKVLFCSSTLLVLKLSWNPT